MTTSQSPISDLRQQADATAKTLKAAALGHQIVNDPAGKIKASINRGTVKFGIVMDDKVITIEMPWKTIRESTEAELAVWIVEQMRGATNTVQ